MLNIYLNYPDSRVEIHGDPGCCQIQRTGKSSQRVSTITHASYDVEITHFRLGEYPFAPTPDRNDLWLRIDLGEETAELRALGRILAVLGARYERLDQAAVARHC